MSVLKSMLEGRRERAALSRLYDITTGGVEIGLLRMHERTGLSCLTAWIAIGDLWLSTPLFGAGHYRTQPQPRPRRLLMLTVSRGRGHVVRALAHRLLRERLNALSPCELGRLTHPFSACGRVQWI